MSDRIDDASKKAPPTDDKAQVAIATTRLQHYCADYHFAHPDVKKDIATLLASHAAQAQRIAELAEYFIFPCHAAGFLCHGNKQAVDEVFAVIADRNARVEAAEARCNRLARGILRIGKKLRVMRADMASQTDALIAAIHAINDAGILMPDEVLDYASGVSAAQAQRPDASCAAECLECDTRGGPWNAKPTDAAVREAVEAAERYAMPNIAFQELISTPHLSSKHLSTLLRAVQAPRLTREQVRAALSLLSEMDKMLGEDIQPEDDRPAALAMQRFCAAFPEAFAGEVGRGE